MSAGPAGKGKAAARTKKPGRIAPAGSLTARVGGEEVTR